MKIAALAAAVFGISASAQIVSFEAEQGIQYALSVPQTTSDSRSGPIFFQISGPTSFQWLAMGFGGPVMAGTNIFVVYADGKGNVTVSPRSGMGFFEPPYNPDAKVELLEGSGIIDGKMIANIRCDNCETWQGSHSLTFGGDQQMIYAHRLASPPLDTTSDMADLTQHDHNGKPFTFDMTKAVTQQTTNPFANNSPALGGTVAQGGSTVSDDVPEPFSAFWRAHGTIMGLCMVILFPFGGLLMRLFSFKGLWAVHAAWQATTLLLLTAGFGIGYWLSGQLQERYSGPGMTHTTLGTCVFAFFWFQPIMGLLAHYMFTKQQSRTIAGHVHAWFGRIIIILGMVNGGLGLKLADNTTGGIIAYGVLAGLVGVAYITIVTTVEIKKTLRSSDAEHGEKPALGLAQEPRREASPTASDLEGYRSSDADVAKTVTNDDAKK